MLRFISFLLVRVFSLFIIYSCCTCVLIPSLSSSIQTSFLNSSIPLAFAQDREEELLNDLSLGPRTRSRSIHVPSIKTQGLTTPVSPDLDTLDQILAAFTQGLIPDLNDPEQRQAFEIYRCLKLGNPRSTLLHTNSMTEVQKTLRKYPQLRKKEFRNYHLSFYSSENIILNQFKKFAKTYLRRMKEITNELYLPIRHPKRWKKILQYQLLDFEFPASPTTPLSASTPLLTLSPLSSQSPRSARSPKKLPLEIRQEMQIQWMQFFEEKVPSSFRERLIEPSLNWKDRGKLLFTLLKTERDRIQSERLDSSPISRAIINLIHYTPYQDSKIQQALETADALSVIQAFREVLEIQDQFARELGFQEGFEEVMRTFDGLHPTGMESLDAHLKTLEKFENGLRSSDRSRPSELTPAETTAAETTPESHTARTIRHLSLIESPFRSCLGLDCSSRTYLLKALDPNFHYFTLTDEEGHSSGQITLVLGTGYQGKKEVNVAFVDKIQNIPLPFLADMLEGIRLSVLEKGYLLALPSDTGDNQGITNYQEIRQFLTRKIPVNRKRDGQIFRFWPHSHNYEFKNLSSRAYEQLPCYPLLPKEENEFSKITPGDINSRWTAEAIPTSTLIRRAISLKYSPSYEDRVKYIHSMETFEKAEIPIDPSFEEVLQNWLEDAFESFQTRKQALIHIWSQRSQTLASLLKYFEAESQIQIIHNLLDTPRYSKRILDEGSQDIDLLILIRQNSKLRSQFMLARLDQRNSRWLLPLYQFLLSSKEIEDESLRHVISEMEKPEFTGGIQAQYFKLFEILKGSKIQDLFQEHSIPIYLNRIQNPSELKRDIITGLSSNQEYKINWTKKIIWEVANSNRNFELTTFENFQNYWEDLPATTSFFSAALSWLKLEDVAISVKQEFLLSNLGTGNHLFEHLLGAIPQTQVSQIRDALQRSSFLGIFVKQFHSSQFPSDDLLDLDPFQIKELLFDFNVLHWFDFSVTHLFDLAKAESFEFVPIDIPPEGVSFWMESPEEGEVDSGHSRKKLIHMTLKDSFEFQRTSVTQLQWHTLMTNYLPFSGTPNLPKTQVTWYQIHQFISKLNHVQDRYDYRLARIEERQYVAQAGTQTAYFFGDHPKELDSFAWHARNSGKALHNVAELQPNPWGIFDIYGNCSEFAWLLWDKFGQLSSRAFDNLTSRVEILESPQYRVTHGGNYLSSEGDCRSGSIDYLEYQESNFSDPTVGFRLVRTRRY